MRCAVVVLTPHVRAQQVVQRRDRPPPGQFAAGGQPFRVLVEHRVDDVHERLVAVEQTVAAGQQIALQPALAQVLGQHFHHAAVGREVLVSGLGVRQPNLAGRLENSGQPVGRGLVGTHETEAVGVARDHVTQEGAQHPGGLLRRCGRLRDRDRVVAEVREIQVAQQQPAVGVRVGAHPPMPAGCQRPQLGAQRAVLVEQLLGTVTAQPLLKLRAVRGVVVRLGKRNLVCSPGALNLLAVNHLRPGPAFGSAQHDHRPHRPVRLFTVFIGARRALNCRNVVEGVVKGGGQLLVHGGRLVSGDRDRPVSVAAQQRFQLGVRDAGQHGRDWRSCIR